MMVTEWGGAKLLYPSSFNPFRFKPESTNQKRPLVDKLHQTLLPMKVTPNLLGEWEISVFFARTIIFCNFQQLSFQQTIRYTVIGAIKGKSKINTSNNFSASW